MKIPNSVCLALLLTSTGVGQTVNTSNTQVYFSPKGGCTDAVVATLTKAKSTVLVQAYTFTSTAIAKALVAAHRRGVKVQVVLDSSQDGERRSCASMLSEAGVPCFIDAQHETAHNKVMVIDGNTVITGSFNFTKAAEEDKAENLLVIHDSDLAAKYTSNWKLHQGHSDPYKGSVTSGKDAKKAR